MNIQEKPYNSYANYMKEKYGVKVYKLPIKLYGITCPNRDGTAGCGGCIFCGDSGGSFENRPSYLSIKEQLLENKAYISKKYKAEKFVAYFQNFTNTYMDDAIFKDYINQCRLDDIVEIAISTRPDCINEEKLIFLEEFQKESGININIELGLQTVNYQILNILNRGHGLSEFIDVMLRLKKHNISSCVHVIIGLPWENDLDIIETAKILNVLGVDQVKVHSLYIVKGTKLGDMYLKGEVSPIKYEVFKKRVQLFLSYLDEKIIVQRLLGRVPEEDSLFCNWGKSWRRIHDEIVEEMNYKRIKQSCKKEGES